MSLNNRNKKIVRRIFLPLAGLALVGGLFVVVSNIVMVQTTKGRLVSREQSKEADAQCILILGAAVWEGNKPSHMLEDRLKEGLALYEMGAAPKIIVSGDHGSATYDEVNVMKQYLMDHGVPSEDIFMDHAGFSTYESMIRAKKVFGVDRMVVVTQQYHMYRALYICDQLGIEAVGVHSDPRTYRGQAKREVREWIARDKALLSCLFRVAPKYLGDPIDITGDGNITNDDFEREEYRNE